MISREGSGFEQLSTPIQAVDILELVSELARSRGEQLLTRAVFPEVAIEMPATIAAHFPDLVEAAGYTMSAVQQLCFGTNKQLKPTFRGATALAASVKFNQREPPVDGRALITEVKYDVMITDTPDGKWYFLERRVQGKDTLPEDSHQKVVEGLGLITVSNETFDANYFSELLRSTAQYHQARKEEFALGLNTVNEQEANEILGCLRRVCE